MKISELLKYGKDELNKYDIDDAGIKTKLLLMHLLDVPKEYLIKNADEDVNDANIKIFDEYLSRLKEGTPIQYITNKQEFMGLTFYVDENVLIPQPDTEILVEEVIKVSEIFDKDFDVLDMCTGSGAIAISLKKNLSNSRMTAVDISEKAIDVAKKNAILNNVNIEFIISDMFNNLFGKKFDVIVSNPPYIETETINSLSKEVQNEPKLALDGGKDGLEFYRIFSDSAYQFLNKDGYLLLEIGFNQKENVTKLLDNGKYTDIYCIKDLSGNDRVIVARKKGE